MVLPAGIVFCHGPARLRTPGSHTADGITHPTYRKGSGPGVIVIHEIPGITPAVIAFAEQVAARGFTVVLPSLFGREEVRDRTGVVAQHRPRLCQQGVQPVRARAHQSGSDVAQVPGRELHTELDGPGVGAVGMCLTGGFALAMLADAPVAAPVLAQPASPAP